MLMGDWGSYKKKDSSGLTQTLLPNGVILWKNPNGISEPIKSFGDLDTSNNNANQTPANTTPPPPTAADHYAALLAQVQAQQDAAARGAGELAR